MADGGTDGVGALQIANNGTALNQNVSKLINAISKLASIILPAARGGTGVNNGTNTFTFSTTMTLAAGASGQTWTFPSSSSNVVTTGNNTTITKRYYVAPNNIGTVTSGTTTPDAANGNYQYLTNNGAFTLAAPTHDSAIDMLVTNGASAGAITFSGFTVGAGTGSALTTTNNSRFLISIRRINSVSTYSVYALQ